MEAPLLMAKQPHSQGLSQPHQIQIKMENSKEVVGSNFCLYPTYSSNKSIKEGGVGSMNPLQGLGRATTFFQASLSSPENKRNTRGVSKSSFDLKRILIL